MTKKKHRKMIWDDLDRYFQMNPHRDIHMQDRYELTLRMNPTDQNQIYIHSKSSPEDVAAVLTFNRKINVLEIIPTIVLNKNVGEVHSAAVALDHTISEDADLLKFIDEDGCIAEMLDDILYDYFYVVLPTMITEGRSPLTDKATWKDLYNYMQQVTRDIYGHVYPIGECAGVKLYINHNRNSMKVYTESAEGETMDALLEFDPDTGFVKLTREDVNDTSNRYSLTIPWDVTIYGDEDNNGLTKDFTVQNGTERLTRLLWHVLGAYYKCREIAESATKQQPNIGGMTDNALVNIRADIAELIMANGRLVAAHSAYHRSNDYGISISTKAEEDILAHGEYVFKLCETVATKANETTMDDNTRSKLMSMVEKIREFAIANIAMAKMVSEFVVDYNKLSKKDYDAMAAMVNATSAFNDAI